jgi:hypothetical protein
MTTMLKEKENLSFAEYCERYLYAASRRHIQLETQLAEMHGIPVRRIDFLAWQKPPSGTSANKKRSGRQAMKR